MSAFLLKNLHCDQSNIHVLFLDITLTFSGPVFVYVNACRNTPRDLSYLFQEQGNLLYF
jgi:hypothetical protein